MPVELKPRTFDNDTAATLGVRQVPAGVRIEITRLLGPQAGYSFDYLMQDEEDIRALFNWLGVYLHKQG